MKTWYVVVVVMALVAVPFTGMSQIPRTLSYQGVVTDSLGHPQPDGNYTFTFRLYDSTTGGSPLWTEVKDLDVVQGLFTTELGDVTPFDGIAFDARYWLGVKFGSAAEMQPRVPLNSVAYSLNAVKADTAMYAKTAPAALFVDSARVADSSRVAGSADYARALVPEMMPVGAAAGFGTHAVPTTATPAWDSTIISVPAAGFLQTTAQATVYLTNAAGCPCTFRGYLYVAGAGYPTAYVADVTLDTLTQRLGLSLTGGISVPSSGAYNIEFRLYQFSGSGAATAYGNASAIWLPASPMMTGAPARREADENTAEQQ